MVQNFEGNTEPFRLVYINRNPQNEFRQAPSKYDHANKMETKTLTQRVGYVPYATLHNITIEAVFRCSRDNASGEEEPHTYTDSEGHEIELASTRF